MHVIMELKVLTILAGEGRARTGQSVWVCGIQLLVLCERWTLDVSRRSECRKGKVSDDDACGDGETDEIDAGHQTLLTKLELIVGMVRSVIEVEVLDCDANSWKERQNSLKTTSTS